MDLIINLKRTYFPEWTTGQISINSVVLSFSIELAWKDNQRHISCIPEGKYLLVIRHSKKYGKHLWIRNIEGRDWILLHPANEATKELKGCIVPVSKLQENGCGSHSRIALDLLIFNIELNKDKLTYINIFS